MFAVIKTGGKQYRVAANDVIRVETVPGDVGATVSFAEVLVVGSAEGIVVGKPLVEGAAVTGEVVDQKRARKVIAFKKRRRKNSRRTRGHRQHLTRVRIVGILGEGGKALAEPPSADAVEAGAAAGA